MLIPDKVRYECGVKVCEKIIPDSAVSPRMIASWVPAGGRMKPCTSMDPIGVTIHNTADLKNVEQDAEQYTRATWPNCNMSGVVVHYYVDDVEAWQNLRENEAGWHASDGSGNGNRRTIAIECIMDGSGSQADLKARDNAARLIAAIMNRHNWGISNLYTHNHWMGLPDQIVPGVRKNCPIFLLPKYSEFKALVQKYLYELANTTAELEKVTLKSGVASTGSDNDAKKIWDFLLLRLDNEFAVAGVMGNLYAESGLKSNNLQNSYEARLSFTDSTYTEAVDNGSYDNFVKDSAGYGFAQWTFWSRKQKLLEFANQKNKSIGDWSTQLSFLLDEMERDFKGMLTSLKASKSVAEAAVLMLDQYEKPAKNDLAVKKQRVDYSQKYYDRFSKSKQTLTEVSLYKVGDELFFKGSKHFTSSNAKEGLEVSKGRVRITSVSDGIHTYHCRAIDDKGNFVAGVHGWVDECDLSEVSLAVITAGSKVRIKAGAVYGGLADTRGTKVPLYVRLRHHTVERVQTNNGVSEALLEEIYSWVAVDHLMLV